MDRQTKHEIWLLAIGTIIFEAPFVAIAALAILGQPTRSASTQSMRTAVQSRFYLI